MFSRKLLLFQRLGRNFGAERLCVGVGCVSLVGGLGITTEASTCSKIQPPLFSVSKRPLSSTKNGHRHSDCPICQKYGNGPCGSLFWVWWDCTEKYGDDNDKAAIKCRQEFARFEDCAEKHPSESTMNNEEQENILEWERFLTEELASIPALEFPGHLRPTVSRKKGLGEVSFVDNDGNRSLLAGLVVRTHVKRDSDNQTGVVAASAAPQMIETKQTLRSLIFWSEETVDILAVYEDEEGSVELFKLHNV